MSSSDLLVTATDGLPTYDLNFRYDDPDDPAEVTVFDTESEDVTTAWLSAAVEDAVGLEDVA